MKHIFAAIRTALSTLVLVLAGAAQAGPTLWVTDFDGVLAKVDATTGTVQVVGNMGRLMTDLAFDPSGQLYGTSLFELYKIDTATAVPTLVGNLTGGTGGTITGLVFAPDGTLYGANDTLHTIDTATGFTTYLGNTGMSYNAGDLAFVGGQLYAASYDFTNDYLFRVDLATGAGTQVGLTGTGEISGLATDDNGTLYGAAGTALYTIDTGTGAATLVASYAGQGLGRANGAAFFSGNTPPIPEPSTCLLMLAGLGLLGMVRGRSAPWKRPLDIHAA